MTAAQLRSTVATAEVGYRGGPPGWQTTYVASLVVADVVAALVGATVAFSYRFGELSVHNQLYIAMFGLLPLCWLVALAMNGGYEPRHLFVGTAEYQRVGRAAIALTASVAVISYAFELPTSRVYVLIALPVALLVSVLLRFLWRRWLHTVRSRGRCVRRVILIGHEGPVAVLTRQLRREHFHGLHVVGACLPGGRAVGPMLDFDAQVYGDFRDASTAVTAGRADTVIVLSCPELDGAALRRMAWQLERGDTELIVASALVDIGGARTSIRPVDGLPMLHLEHARLTGTRRLVKELFDRVVAGLLLVALSPVLAVIALLVRCTSTGGALFSQVRIGRGGQPFTIWKFRTMHANAPARLAALAKLNEADAVLFKMRSDPRVTPVGRVLRRFSLDELPQLWNVVRGDMSLVGPRPPLPSEVADYAEHVRRRLAVKPGLTGLWQISGRSDLPWDEAVRLDLRYVEHWSLSLDLVILARTVTAVLRSSGAY
ncbi:Undecaprenyl-phosphate galactose phosphotransferase WbaP/exopolysaccharide biosynthesis polyprenyl glycosylphosphotransferase [Stackebrandtia endophytica]|uniref:Undecaprenyl-phosphate galactose phosphotransferase WbaP/exopolysaccharide biosynthesis polyprenyl glycosylphosphotransferase n=1 Tax=Stackebrandtia endophytica TaxID=1496996 RepID=A0A543B090_9ACTN|nr:sugar transferase [Stackebrandtia endophytica]TQL78248.1 Undecaprenyl-phosphate galactose phosphotransferase WbaP/exopolysaccharide biosynthesis polyprenyl glycosylphosphotransferase [Stackebrandtia endophytica]